MTNKEHCSRSWAPRTWKTRGERDPHATPPLPPQIGATPSPMSTPPHYPSCHPSVREHRSAQPVRSVRLLPTRSPGLTRPIRLTLRPIRSEKEKKNPNYLLNQRLQTAGTSGDLSSDVSLSAASLLFFAPYTGGQFGKNTEVTEGPEEGEAIGDGVGAGATNDDDVCRRGQWVRRRKGVKRERKGYECETREKTQKRKRRGDFRRRTQGVSGRGKKKEGRGKLEGGGLVERNSREEGWRRGEEGRGKPEGGELVEGERRKRGRGRRFQLTEGGRGRG